MNPATLYVFTVSDATFILIEIHLAHDVLHLINKYLMRFLTRHFIYLNLLSSNRVYYSFTRYHLALLLLYWFISVACIIIDVKFTDDERVRTGTIFIINMTLLYVNQPALTADIVDVSLRSYIKVHTILAQMTFAQALAHVIIWIRIGELSTNDCFHLFELLIFWYYSSQIYYSLAKVLHLVYLFIWTDLRADSDSQASLRNIHQDAFCPWTAFTLCIMKTCQTPEVYFSNVRQTVTLVFCLHCVYSVLQSLASKFRLW